MLNSPFYLSFIYVATDFCILNKEVIITCWIKHTIDIGKNKSSFYKNIEQHFLSLRKAMWHSCMEKNAVQIKSQGHCNCSMVRNFAQ